MMDKDRFLKVISQIFSWKIIRDDEKFFKIYPFNEVDGEGDPNTFILLDIKKLEKNVQKLKNIESLFDGCALYSGTTYEILISRTTNFFSNPNYLEKLKSIEDFHNNLSYSISDISSELYLLFMQTFIEKNQDIAYFLRPFPREIIELMANHQNIELMDLLSKNFRFFSLKIQSTEKKTQDFFHSLVISHLFDITYRTNIIFVPFHSMEVIFKSYRSFSDHREKFFEPPRKIYDPTVVSYYQMARTTENPSLKFLSFYQILEFFFNVDYYDSMMNNIKEKLAHPSFSYTNDKSIQELISLINNQFRTNKSPKTKTEQERLITLLLKNFEDFSSLTDQLNILDTTLIDHYLKNQVTFCNGKTIDFNNSDRQQICEKLASRIYNIRNAIVHSKEDNDNRFIPFRHDKELFREMPLIQLLSEEVIIKNSQNL
jgi:hypothetical protein